MIKKTKPLMEEEVIKKETNKQTYRKREIKGI
jgi:hypothetical protein